MTVAMHSQRPHNPKCFVLVTFGSLGDLHPYLALALELRARGHQTVIAANDSHRRTVEAEGIAFHTVRPDLTDFGEEAALMKKFMNAHAGPEFVIRELLLPKLRDSYAYLSAACTGTDMLVSHPLTFAVPLVAAKMRTRGLTWASVGIAPTVFLSAYDPPVFAPAPWLHSLRALGPGFYGMRLRLLEYRVRTWVEPWHQFRSELGLPPIALNPLFDGHSPELVLALFPSLLAAAQPD